jgi:hypothetical protein
MVVKRILGGIDPELGAGWVQSKSVREDHRKLLVRLLLPCIINVLDPEVEITVELASGPVEDEENSPLAAMPSGPNTESFCSFFGKGVEVHLILNVSHKIDWLRATRIELVLEIRPSLDDRGNFILAVSKSAKPIFHPRALPKANALPC